MLPARADKSALVRRLSLDLVGLPPTIEEIDRFLSDESPNAYEKQVDRLLASPHYGERWARIWLDAARYADSDGYEKDKPRFVWAYRDWVVGAFNRDKPYSQFIIEQIAGDLLPGSTQDQSVATGFLRNSMINEEGGIDPEQFRMEAMFDRMDALGKSVLGLTIQCAQCHSHKYDPITQEDYYRMFAFLNNSHEANVAVYSPEEQMTRRQVLAEAAAAEAELMHRHPDWKGRFQAWENEVKESDPVWTVVKPEVDEESTGGSKYLLLEDGSFLASGYAPTKHTVEMKVKLDKTKVNAFRLELLNDPNLPMSGPGRSIEGTCALTEFEVEAAPASAPGKTQKIKIKRASADVRLPETPLASIYDDKSNKKRVIGPIEFAFDDKDETAWGVDEGPGRRNVPREAIFFAETPIGIDGEFVLTFRVKQNHGGWNSDDNQTHNLGRFRLSVASEAKDSAKAVSPITRAAMAVPPEERSEQQWRTCFQTFRKTAQEWKDDNERIEAIWKRHPAPATQLALMERDQTRPTHRLERGDFLKPKEQVEPGVPAFLGSLPKNAPKNRLGLAQWLVDKQNPTTSRSIVNRVWQAHFGVGLVSTSEDLGSQCEPPSHPELLDWLAVEFMDSGWRLKALHKMIVMSSTYQQSSKPTAELLARDPMNRLLSRGPRFRVDAEVVRDAALAASGLLNEKVGGPSVFPPAPEFLFAPPASYGPKVWKESHGPDRYRRALYTFRFRSVPYPALQAFDAPNGDFSCVRRARSNTPIQALTVLNEPLFLECAGPCSEDVGRGGRLRRRPRLLRVPQVRGAKTQRRRSQGAARFARAPNPEVLHCRRRSLVACSRRSHKSAQTSGRGDSGFACRLDGGGPSPLEPG